MGATMAYFWPFVKLRWMDQPRQSPSHHMDKRRRSERGAFLYSMKRLMRGRPWSLTLKIHPAHHVSHPTPAWGHFLGDFYPFIKLRWLDQPRQTSWTKRTKSECGAMISASHTCAYGSRFHMTKQYLCTSRVNGIVRPS